MNKKAQGFSVGLLIAVIIGVIVLVIVALGFAYGWSNLWDKMTSFTGGSNLASASQACSIACSQGMGGKTAFCTSAQPVIKGLTAAQVALVNAQHAGAADSSGTVTGVTCNELAKATLIDHCSQITC